MKFIDTPIKGARLISLDKRGDDRGFFARLFCRQEFRTEGLQEDFVQINNSLTASAGTMRGMHLQLPPHGEVKVVRCIQGALFDVIADLRPDSPTFGTWFGAELSARNRQMMYVPRGCAHGFLTLEQNTEALYLVSDAYAPEFERGIRFDDPAFRIDWPIEPIEISAKDRNWPDIDLKGALVEELRGLA
ncbi:MAG: dTDP-4-dehydrorhamnose 3,5-epimerase [Thalassobaculum sp.]